MRGLVGGAGAGDRLARALVRRGAPRLRDPHQQEDESPHVTHDQVHRPRRANWQVVCPRNVACKLELVIHFLSLPKKSRIDFFAFPLPTDSEEDTESESDANDSEEEIEGSNRFAYPAAPQRYDRFGCLFLAWQS